jgi:hypothetical protein
VGKTVAVLLDGGFVQKRLYRLLGRKMPTAKDLLAFANKCVVPDEELFRIYCYDCPPFGWDAGSPHVRRQRGLLNDHRLRRPHEAA